MSIGKTIYDSPDYVSAVIPVGASYDCPEIDCYKMDVLSFIGIFPALMTADVKLMMSNANGVYVDSLIVIDPLDGIVLERSIRVQLNGIRKARLRFENILIGGQVDISAFAKGL